MPLTKENIENLAYEIIGTEINAQVYVINNVNDIFRKTYRNVYVMIQDKNMYYDVLISCPHAKDKDSIKKIGILNKHLLIHVGVREYRYGVIVEDGDYIMPGLIYIIYLSLPDDAKDILKWSVRN